jgi:hypothetical protein
MELGMADVARLLEECRFVAEAEAKFAADVSPRWTSAVEQDVRLLHMLLDETAGAMPSR